MSLRNRLASAATTPAAGNSRNDNSQSNINRARSAESLAELAWKRLPAKVTRDFRRLLGVPEAGFLDQEPGAAIHLYQELISSYKNKKGSPLAQETKPTGRREGRQKRKIAGDAQSPNLESLFTSAGWRRFVRARWKLAAQGARISEFHGFRTSLIPKALIVTMAYTTRPKLAKRGKNTYFQTPTTEIPCLNGINNIRRKVGARPKLLCLLASTNRGLAPKLEGCILLYSTQPTTTTVESGSCAGFGTKMRFSQMQEFRKMRKRECPLESTKVWFRTAAPEKKERGAGPLAQRLRAGRFVVQTSCPPPRREQVRKLAPQADGHGVPAPPANPGWRARGYNGQ
jgi:hypothetical protein